MLGYYPRPRSVGLGALDVVTTGGGRFARLDQMCLGNFNLKIRDRLLLGIVSLFY